ncbi:MAG: class I SAM-dependent methyltransferase [Bacilli bacterium]|jgi:methylase of polypeptide subunit release factors|nr:class I SAM-dependent methyltransferase [Bacilli bacterium]HHU23563.1 methyltransferase domain-containing protein [Acholeplasmataceae bacterium]
MTKMTEIAHQLLRERLKEGNIVVDATCGNGFDTVFLANLVGPNGTVHAYDIQPIAIERTKKMANELGLTNIEYHLESHEHIDLPRIDGIIFNLGYLPTGDKTITTEPEIVLRAVQKLINYIGQNPSLFIVIVLYPGHEKGKKESLILESFLSHLDASYLVSKIVHLNQNNAPYILTVERKRP